MMDFVTNYGHMISLELQELAAVNFYGCGTKIMDFTVAEAGPLAASVAGALK